ncbi:unnamed protein product [Dibothriocephalus latus]|uniref:Uncharacterized protein n=1 Tax=Dibothriocephalus latus TaxID=60516 RepID=A0A3P6QFY7_DIBLA|nr:unnamed protein product [Dibothriocephalus latus]
MIGADPVHPSAVCLFLLTKLNLEEKHSDMRTLQQTLEEEKKKRATKSSGLHSELEAEYEQLLSQIANLR